MKSVGRACGSGVALAAILICPIALIADPVIISVSAAPELSTLIASDRALSTSWSASSAYTDVSIAVLLDSAIVGQTPTADAFLTTRIGPGTTTTEEIARTQFAVPAETPICHAGCGAMVSLFSGLSLGPGTYFLTMGPDAASNGNVGWFPALNPTVVEAPGVTQGASFVAFTVASYAPASPFEPADPVSSNTMNLTVTGTAAATPVPEPIPAILFGIGVLLFLLKKRTQACIHHE